MSSLKPLHWLVDGRVQALNLALTLSVSDYLHLLERIIDANELQRTKVRSRNPRVLLKKDLLAGCVIPPIVLACSDAGVARIREILHRNVQRGSVEDEDALFDQVREIFHNRELIILDGLQRSYAIREASESTEDAEAVKKFLQRSLRIELQLGLSKRGLLYRMLTLNTGQTPMTLKHQLEILYKDFETSGTEFGVELFSEKSGKKPKEIGQFAFADAVNMYHARLVGDASPIDREGIVDEMQKDGILDSYANEPGPTDDGSDVFKDTLKLYLELLQRLDQLAAGWMYGSEGEVRNPFGRTIFEIFSKGQPMSSFGAALRKLLGARKNAPPLIDHEQLRTAIENLRFEEPVETTLDLMIRILGRIQTRSKKVGDDQREFFFDVFRFTFDPDGHGFGDFSGGVSRAATRIENSF